MKLSVLVPVYNLQNYLPATIESLLNIDFPYEHEIIFINDGSKDRSREIIEEYQKKAARLKLLNTENGGVSRARNIGLAAAGGEYISFVDGDDTVEHGFFRTAVDEMDGGGYDFIQCNFLSVSEKGSEIIQYNPEDIVISDKNRMLLRFFGSGKTINNSVCGKVFRADLIKGRQFDSTIKIAEDQKFVFDTICASEKIKLLKTAGYHYIQRTSSAMHSLDRKRAQDILSVLEYCRGRVDSDAVKTLIDEEKLDVLFFVYNDLLLSGESGEQAYSEIVEMDHRAMWRVMSARARVKSMLIRHARTLYDRILFLQGG